MTLEDEMGSSFKGKNVLRWEQILPIVRVPKFIRETNLKITELISLKVYIFTLRYVQTSTQNADMHV